MSVYLTEFKVLTEEGEIKVFAGPSIIALSQAAAEEYIKKNHLPFKVIGRMERRF